MAQRPLKKQRSSSMSLGLEDDVSVMSGSASSVNTIQGTLEASAFLATRPAEETTAQTIMHMIANPCSTEEVVGMLSQTDLKKKISIQTNERNMKVYEYQQKECHRVIQQVDDELMLKRGILEDFTEEARQVNEKLVLCHNEVQELTNARDTAQTSMGLWQNSYRKALLVSALNRNMLETAPDLKPFAKPPLSTIRKMMDLERVDKLTGMSDRGIHRRLWICFNMGIEANEEFQELWDPEKNNCENWIRVLGPDPKILKGKVQGQTMKNRLIDYLDIQGEEIDIDDCVPKNVVLRLDSINEDMEDMTEVEIQARINVMMASLERKKRAREE